MCFSSRQGRKPDHCFRNNQCRISRRRRPESLIGLFHLMPLEIAIFISLVKRRRLGRQVTRKHICTDNHIYLLLIVPILPIAPKAIPCWSAVASLGFINISSMIVAKFKLIVYMTFLFASKCVLHGFSFKN